MIDFFITHYLNPNSNPNEFKGKIKAADKRTKGMLKTKRPVVADKEDVETLSSDENPFEKF